ncbi:MAG: HD domain-containing protein [Anaerolineales bacterium]|nr:HD domain-containing protein [Anaerolineales bacterium]
MPTIEAARTWYPIDDPVHGFDHVLRVLALAERLAQAEGADLEIVRAAVLLHDAEGEARSNNRLAHHHASAEFARQVLSAENWPEERIAAVQHCIRAHRFRDSSQPPQSQEARILFDADKLDAIGAIGVARAIAYAARAGQPAYSPPSDEFIKTGKRQPGEPHSAYHEHIYKLRKLKDMLHTPSARRIADERHQLMEAYFERLAAEVRGEA